ncbi:MAG: glucosaminidase domain-containing protein [Candidatus Rifleibacteriota bacterium]
MKKFRLKLLISFIAIFGIMGINQAIGNNPFSEATIEINPNATDGSDANNTEIDITIGASDTERNTNEDSNSVRTITVVRGDYLSKLAQIHLGDASRWPEIVNLNYERYPSLLKNPDLIYPGWELKIPGGSSTNSNTTPSTSTSTSGTTNTNPPSASASEAEAALANYRGGRLSPSEFGRLFGPVARESQRRTGIPASIILAQAALETGWGRATMGDGKNLFGIKGTGPAGSISVPTREYINGRYVNITDNFRKYNTWMESIEDHARLLQNSRYAECMRNSDNPDQFARELQRAGYATDPQYASKLISIMRSNNFYQYNI